MVTGLLAQLRAQRVLAIVRGPDPAAAMRALGVLADAGIQLAEVSLTSADALMVIRQAVGELGDRMAIGAGTVISESDADEIRAAGAAFAVSPGLSAGIRRASELGLPALTGALTPSEILAAHAGGATAVKVFPASAGGPSYLRSLREPLGHIPMVPVGGVAIADIPAYLEAGAAGVGLGSPLMGDALTGGDLESLAGRARDALAAASLGRDGRRT